MSAKPASSPSATGLSRVRYQIRYFDPARGGVQEEVVEASSEASLRQQWGAQGRVVLSLHAQAAAPQRRSGHALAGWDVGWWCRELRTLLAAGMTAVEALESLQAQAGAGACERVQASLLRSLYQGQALSAAMRQAGVFPEVLLASVTASERTSTLVTALDDFMRYDEMIRALRRKAWSAAIYPAVVVALGALIALFLLVYVVPRFSKMYVDFHGGLSGATQVLLWLSRLINERTHWLLLGVAVLVAAAVLAWRQGWPQRMGFAVLARITPLQRQLDHFRLAKLYQSLALMFKGGYTLDEALQVCEGLDIGARIGQGIQAARLEMVRGRAVATAFASAALTEPVSERLLAVGERSGSFEAVLQTIADRHAQAFSVFVERATRVVEPLLMLVVALVVGGIVVMMYMPIFDIANGIR